MVSCLYYPDVFLTDEVYSKSNGVLANLQVIVEKPFLHILAHSPSTDQHLLYSDKRLGEILEIKKPIKKPDGIQIYDTVRTFKGDHPTSQFEAGQRNGGSYAYYDCCIKSILNKVYSHWIKSIPHHSTINLLDRISKIHTTACSKEWNIKKY